MRWLQISARSLKSRNLISVPWVCTISSLLGKWSPPCRFTLQRKIPNYCVIMRVRIFQECTAKLWSWWDQAGSLFWSGTSCSSQPWSSAQWVQSCCNASCVLGNVGWRESLPGTEGASTASFHSAPLLCFAFALPGSHCLDGITDPLTIPGVCVPVGSGQAWGGVLASVCVTDLNLFWWDIETPLSPPGGSSGPGRREGL